LKVRGPEGRSPKRRDEGNKNSQGFFLETPFDSEETEKRIGHTTSKGGIFIQHD